MATLTVTAPTDFRGLPEELSIDSLIFATGGARNLVATFAPEQFGAGLISPSLAVQGGATQDHLRVLASAGAAMSFSAAGWSFSSWGAADRLTFIGSALNDIITGSGQRDLIRGERGNDALDGGGGNNSIVGGAGADTLTGATGSDTLLGGDGHDLLIGGNGLDLLSGGAGHDRLEGGAQGDTLEGGAGNDTLAGGRDAGDVLIGGPGDDYYEMPWHVDYDAPDSVTMIEEAGGGTDTIYTWGSKWTTYQMPDYFENLILVDAYAGDTISARGNDGDNVITGNSQLNRLEGAGGNDSLYGGGQDNSLYGGEGNDTLNGGSNRDLLVGGPGDDTYIVSSPDVVHELPGEGIDTILAGGAEDFSLADYPAIENLVLTFWYNGTGNDLANRITGNQLDNTLAGEGGDDTILGGTGNDTIRGGDGANSIDGGDGADRMEGGAGSDIYVNPTLNGTAPDTIVELAGGGDADEVQSSQSVSIAATPFVERILLTGARSISAGGNSLDNLITGNGGRNTLSGREGNDTLRAGAGDDVMNGGAGDDLMNGGTGADVFVFGAASGQDRIAGFSVSEDRFDLAGGSFSAAVAGGGNTVLIHAGGSVRIEEVSGLTLEEWNALVLPAGGELSLQPLRWDAGLAASGGDWAFA